MSLAKSQMKRIGVLMAPKEEWHKVFVYGTLRPKGAEATHYLLDYTMYDCGKFPYIKATHPDGCVYGNILQVTEEELLTLDKIEGVERGLYKREPEEVLPIDGTWGEDVEDVWVYVAGNITDPVIASGDWFKR